MVDSNLKRENISNRVYQMTYRIREDTAYDHKLKKQVPVAWYVSWSVEYNLPPRKDPYYSRPSPLAGQDNKRYGDKAAAERYVQGRIAAYAGSGGCPSLSRARTPHPKGSTGRSSGVRLRCGMWCAGTWTRLSAGRLAMESSCGSCGVWATR